MCRGAGAPRGQSPRRSHRCASDRSGTRAPAPVRARRLGSASPSGSGRRTGRAGAGSAGRRAPGARQAAARRGARPGWGLSLGAELVDCSGKSKVRRVGVCVCVCACLCFVCERETHLGTWVDLRCMVGRTSACPRVGPGVGFSWGMIFVARKESGCPAMSGGCGSCVQEWTCSHRRRLVPLSCALIQSSSPSRLLQEVAATGTTSLPATCKEASTRREQGC